MRFYKIADEFYDFCLSNPFPWTRYAGVISNSVLKTPSALRERVLTEMVKLIKTATKKQEF